MLAGEVDGTWPVPHVAGRRAGPAPTAGADSRGVGARAAVAVAILRRADDRRDGRGLHGDRGHGAAARRGSRAGAWWPRRDTWGGRTWRRRLRSFVAEGVWGTSPHLIPHFALHSPSGTISLALGLHGPNLGVGGGLHAAAEGFLAALTWLAAGRRAGRLAGPQRLVAGAGPATGRERARRRRMPGPGAGAGGRGQRRGRGRCSGLCSARSRSARGGPDRPESAGRRHSSARRRAVAPGRSRPIRAGGSGSSWSTGRMARDEATMDTVGTGLDHGRRGRDTAGLRARGDRGEPAGRPVGRVAR